MSEQLTFYGGKNGYDVVCIDRSGKIVTSGKEEDMLRLHEKYNYAVAKLSSVAFAKTDIVKDGTLEEAIRGTVNKHEVGIDKLLLKCGKETLLAQRYAHYVPTKFGQLAIQVVESMGDTWTIVPTLKKLGAGKWILLDKGDLLELYYYSGKLTAIVTKEKGYENVIGNENDSIKRNMPEIQEYINNWLAKD